MTTTLEFTGSTTDRAAFHGFTFYLNSEGAQSTISKSCLLKSLYCPAAGGSHGYTLEDVYLNFWEGNGTDAYTYLGTSSNKTHNDVSLDCTWTFDNLVLSPSKKYLVIPSYEPLDTFTYTSFQLVRLPLYALNTAESTHTFCNSLTTNPPTFSGNPPAWGVKMTLTLDDLPKNVTKVGINQISDKVYTADNLVAGNNISIENKTIQEGLDEYTQLLLHFDDSLDDSSSNNCTYPSTGYSVTYGTGKFDKAFNKFTSTPTTLPVYTKSDNSTFDISNGMTVEYWQYVDLSQNTNPMYPDLICVTPYETEQKWYLRSGTDSNKFYISYNLCGVTSSPQYQDISSYVVNNDWNHLAFVFSPENYIKVYLNGHCIFTYTGEWTSLQNVYGYISKVVLEGNLYGSNGDTNIDEFRFSNTVRYTGDAFTVPTQPFSVPKTVKAINSNDSVQSTNISDIVTLSQAEYDALVQAGTVNPSTFYIMVEDSDESN